MTSVKGVIDVAARLSRGSLNIELPALRLVTFAVVNWNDKDERFILCLSHICHLFVADCLQQLKACKGNIAECFP